MKIPDELRKAVGFIAFENMTNAQIVPVGSFFFLGHDPKPGETFSRKVYAVTAHHVIDALQRRGIQNVILRLNPKDQKADIINKKVPVANWFRHRTDQSIDVAICEIAIDQAEDHLVIPFSMCMSAEIQKEWEIDLGDEVFISGLFHRHFGTKRNIPIIRIGNLAARNDEKISVDTYGEIDGFLVEARSTGGLSGSPVFVNLGAVRVVRKELKYDTSDRPFTPLLGLVHGHFIFRGKHASSRVDAINSGIAIVVSVMSIRAVIEEFEAQGK
jgi:hypothetical protein